MELSESAQNYLETILLLQSQHGPLRPARIAERLGFSRPSVSHAVGLLREAGYVQDEHGRVSLTPKGEEAAKEVYERHLLLKRMLCSFGVREEIAELDACRMEHVISAESVACLRRFFGLKSGSGPIVRRGGHNGK